MNFTRTPAGIPVGLGAAIGAVGAAAMLSAVVAPAAHADDFTDIITAVEGDYSEGTASFELAASDFGSADVSGGLAAFLTGVDEDFLAAPDNFIVGSVEALQGQPVDSSYTITVGSDPGSFAAAVAEAQSLDTQGGTILSDAATAFLGGDYTDGVYDSLVGSDYYTVAAEVLALGAADGLGL
jgi:hypothetical protein